MKNASQIYMWVDEGNKQSKLFTIMLADEENKWSRFVVDANTQLLRVLNGG